MYDKIVVQPNKTNNIPMNYLDASETTVKSYIGASVKDVVNIIYKQIKNVDPRVSHLFLGQCQES